MSIFGFIKGALTFLLLVLALLFMAEKGKQSENSTIKGLSEGIEGTGNGVRDAVRRIFKKESPEIVSDKGGFFEKALNSCWDFIKYMFDKVITEHPIKVVLFIVALLYLISKRLLLKGDFVPPSYKYEGGIDNSFERFSRGLKAKFDLPFDETNFSLHNFYQKQKQNFLGL